MKRRIISALVVLLLVVALIGADAYLAMPQEPAQPEVPEFVPNVVDLYFPSNPTTGYSWTCEVEDPSVVAVRDQFFEDSAELGFVGNGGTHWFHLSGLKPGATSVIFRYARSWELDSATSTTHYRLTVDENLNVMIWGVEVC